MALDRRVNLRVSLETYEAYEVLAEVVGEATGKLMRQALDATAPQMRQLATAFKAVAGGKRIQGFEMYQRVIDSIAAQAEAERHQAAAWAEQVREEVPQASA